MKRLESLIPCSIIFLLLFSSSDLAHPPAKRRTIRVMTFNIHHGEGTDGKLDLERIAQVIRHERADIVALQEVDRGVERTSRRDLVAELAKLTKMSYAFGKNITYQGGDYGNAILTRFRIIKQDNHHYKMLREGEQRGLLQTVLEADGKRLLLLNTHIDYRPDDSERVMNVEEIKLIISDYKNLPVILCGDFNDVPDSRTHKKVKEAFIDSWEAVGAGDGLTYSSVKPEKRIDYVFIKRGTELEPIKAQVIKSDASDHFPLVVEISIK
jgi:endonuclease/exonuclease/phosphatase family metal-dependent hydrolase